MIAVFELYHHCVKQSMRFHIGKNWRNMKVKIFYVNHSTVDKGKYILYIQLYI